MKSVGTEKSFPKISFITKGTLKTTNALALVRLSVNHSSMKANGSTVKSQEAESTPTSKKTSSTKESGNATRSTAKDTSSHRLEYTMECLTTT